MESTLRSTQVGVLGTNEVADYERQSSYSIIVRLTDSEHLSVDRAVTVTVLNRNDDGRVMLSVRAPQVGKRATAMLGDDDGGLHAVKWQWFRALATEEGTACPRLSIDSVTLDQSDAVSPVPVGDWKPIPGAKTSAYVPSKGGVGNTDVGHCLAAVVSYRDLINPSTGGEEVVAQKAVGVSEGVVQEHGATNSAPTFTASSMTREVRENTQPDTDFDIAVVADDADKDKGDLPDSYLGRCRWGFIRH